MKKSHFFSKKIYCKYGRNYDDDYSNILVLRALKANSISIFCLFGLIPLSVVILALAISLSSLHWITATVAILLGIVVAIKKGPPFKSWKTEFWIDEELSKKELKALKRKNPALFKKLFKSADVFSRAKALSKRDPVREASLRTVRDIAKELEEEVFTIREEAALREREKKEQLRKQILAELKDQ